MNFEHNIRFNNNLISKMNRRLIIDLIRTRGPINRAEVARITGLSIPTVMKITDELSDLNMIRVIGKRKSAGGKRPELYEFIPDVYYSLGIDIGRNRIKIVMMDMAANILHQDEIETFDTLPADALISRIIDLIKNVLQACQLSEDQILGLGVGMPGLLDSEAGIVLFSPDFQWEHIPLIERLEEEFPFRTILENSNRTLALGEQWFGAGMGSNDLICVNLGYGIGAGIIEHGELVQGFSGSNGEFGHIILERNGPKCKCGNYGCLEAISSGYAIAETAKTALLNGKASTLSAICQNNLANLEAKMVFESAKKGDKLSCEIINRSIEYIGIGIATLINLFDPEQIILAGGLTKSKDFFEKSLNKYIQSFQMKFAGRKVRIKYGELGDYGSAIGAATLLVKQLIDNGGILQS